MKDKKPTKSSQLPKRQKISNLPSPNPAPAQQAVQNISINQNDRSHLPPDQPETFKQHPNFQGIRIGTLGTYLRNGVRIETPTMHLFLKEAGYSKPGLPKRINRAIEMAKTFLGPPPSQHHFLKFIDGKKDPSNLRLSNLCWASHRHVLTIEELSSLNLRQLLPPCEQYSYCKNGHIYKDGLELKEDTTNHKNFTVTMKDSNGKQCTPEIHLLIGRAEYFYQFNKPIPEDIRIYHGSKGKKDNSPGNLRFLSQKDANKTTAKSQMQPVKAISIEDGDILAFASLTEAAEYFKQKGAVNISNWIKNATVVAFNGKDWKFQKDGNIEKPMEPRRLAPTDREWIIMVEDTNFEISERGEIRHKDSQLLVPQYIRSNYFHVTLDGRIYAVHRLVLLSFVGPAPSLDHHADHIGENKLHNCRSQLRWNDKNVEYSCGQPCERKLMDGTWQRFMSVTAAANELAKEANNVLSFGDHRQPYEGPLTEQAMKKLIDGKRSGLRILFKSPDRTQAYGFQWRALVRGPDVEFVCPDCHETFTRRGDWQTPENQLQ